MVALRRLDTNVVVPSSPSLSKEGEGGKIRRRERVAEPAPRSSPAAGSTGWGCTRSTGSERPASSDGYTDARPQAGHAQYLSGRPSRRNEGSRISSAPRSLATPACRCAKSRTCK